jgi:hypothetical protein
MSIPAKDSLKETYALIHREALTPIKPQLGEKGSTHLAPLTMFTIVPKRLGQSILRSGALFPRRRIPPSIPGLSRGRPDTTKSHGTRY